MNKRIVIVAISALWLAVVTGGMKVLWDYESASGKSARPPLKWPQESFLSLDKKIPTLILFAHPRCPCTRATVSELARIVAQARGRAKYYTFFLSPENFPENFNDEWVKTDLWNEVQSIPDIDVREDHDGREASLFQVATSGNVVLYGTDGRLLFHGGITPTRGHVGDNAGHDSVVALLRGQTRLGTGPGTESPVFGCPLSSEASADLSVCPLCETEEQRNPLSLKLKRILSSF